MYLISKDGEQQLVESLDGYEDWAVVQADLVLQHDDEAELVGGQWVVPVEVLQRRKRAEVDHLLEQAFAAGFSPADGPLAGSVLQVRDTTDRTNWLTSQATYGAAIAAGYGDVVDASFRTAANETIVATYREGFETLMAMAAWGLGLMGRSWSLKDAIDALPDQAAIEDFDVATQWASAE